MEKMEKSPEKKPNLKNQFFAALVANIPIIANTISLGWSSAAVILLTSDETPLPSGRISMEEASWMTSILYIGGLVGTFFFGYISKHFGRKWPLIFSSSLMIICWLLVYFAQNVYYIYAARLLTGFFGGGITVIANVYLVEVASDRVRGNILSLLGVSASIGMLIGFSLGAFFNYYVTPVVVIALLILFAIAFVFFPETPVFLLQKNKVTEMEKSIQFYQNIDMDKLKKEIANSETNSSRSSFKWSDLKSNPARKAAIIGIVLTLLCNFSGISAILIYSGTVFKETGSTMTPNTSTVVIGIIQVVGSLTSNYLFDRAGRKIIYTMSTIGLGLGLSILGVYMMLKSWNYAVDKLNWIPLLSLSFSIFTSSLAVHTNQFLVISETLPNNIKEFGIAVFITISYLLTFAMAKILPFLMSQLQFYGCMFLFTVCCLFGAWFIILYMPETKGKSYEQIMESLK